MVDINIANLGSLSLGEDTDVINELKETSGRVCNFTFNYFFTWFWLCTLVFVVVFSFFVTVYRKLRGDEATFLQKLGYKAKGLKRIHQQREDEIE